MEEIVDLGIEDIEPLKFSLKDDDDNRGSVSFGPGIELLMNDKKKSGSSSTNFDIDDLNDLENELNDLSNTSSKSTAAASSSSSGNKKSIFTDLTDMFGFSSSNTGNTGRNDSQGGGGNSNSGSRLLSDYEKSDSKIGKATVNSFSGVTKSYDGYGKINDIPFQNGAMESDGARLSDKEKRRKKRMMLRKLEEWYEKGIIKNSSHFNMDSDYSEIEDEYETYLEEKRRKDSIKLQSWWFITLVNSIEYGNTLFNPFDLNLDGWGEQVSEDIDSYEDIFTELHNKYKGGKLSPELSLLLRLGFSAAVVNITNKALSSSTPGFNDIIKQSPELMKMFSNATVQSMSNQHPSASFMTNILNQKTEQSVNTSFGPPPPPVQTKNPPPSASYGKPQMTFTSNTPPNRPDLNAGRGGSMAPPGSFAEKGIEISNMGAPTSGGSMSYAPPPPPQAPPQQRQEMRGPNADINQLLSGLKIKPPGAPSSAPSMAPPSTAPAYDDNDSIISVSSLKDLQNTSIPKKSNRRKPRSEKNVMHLDL